MATAKFFTISEAARLLGKEKNRKLLRKLIRKHKVPVFQIGASTVMDEEGFELLKALVEEWDNRPTLAESPAIATA